MEKVRGLVLVVACLAGSVVFADDKPKEKPSGLDFAKTASKFITVQSLHDDYVKDSETAATIYGGKLVCLRPCQVLFVDELDGGRLLARIFVSPGQTANCYVEKEDVEEFSKVAKWSKEKGGSTQEMVALVGTVGKPTRSSIVLNNCRFVYGGKQVDVMSKMDDVYRERK